MPALSLPAVVADQVAGLRRQYPTARVHRVVISHGDARAMTDDTPTLIRMALGGELVGDLLVSTSRYLVLSQVVLLDAYGMPMGVVDLGTSAAPASATGAER